MGVFTVMIFCLAYIVPSLAAWHWARRRRQKLRPEWRLAGVALAIGVISSVTLWVTVSIPWLLSFNGICGGWLGEATSCAFNQYALEVAFAAFAMLAVPASIGTLATLPVLFLMAFFFRRLR